MSHRRSSLLALALGLSLAAGCGSTDEPTTPPRLGQPEAEREPAAEPEPEPTRPEPAQREAPPPPPAAAAPAEDQRAPDRYVVRLETTKGAILIDVDRSWAPRGADRFYTLVRSGYFTDIAFFRVIEGFMAQAGIHGDPEVARQWRNRNIDDDPVRQSNTRGMVSFATSGANSRSTQFFINFGNNANLDAMGFSPFGRVRDMSVVDRLHSGYGEGAPRGRGPLQQRIQTEGNTYLRSDFPDLDYIRSASIEEG